MTLDELANVMKDQQGEYHSNKESIVYWDPHAGVFKSASSIDDIPPDGKIVNEVIRHFDFNIFDFEIV
jgi:hypothetical protein